MTMPRKGTPNREPFSLHPPHPPSSLSPSSSNPTIDLVPILMRLFLIPMRHKLRCIRSWCSDFCEEEVLTMAPISANANANTMETKGAVGSSDFDIDRPKFRLTFEEGNDGEEGKEITFLCTFKSVHGVLIPAIDDPTFMDLSPTWEPSGKFTSLRRKAFWPCTATKPSYERLALRFRQYLAQAEAFTSDFALALARASSTNVTTITPAFSPPTSWISGVAKNAPTFNGFEPDLRRILKSPNYNKLREAICPTAMPGSDFIFHIFTHDDCVGDKPMLQVRSHCHFAANKTS